MLVKQVDFSDKIDFSLKESFADGRNHEKPNYFPRRSALGLLMMNSFQINASKDSLHRVVSRLNGVPLMMAICLLVGSTTGCSSLLFKTKGQFDNLDTSGLKQAGYTFGEYGAQRPLATDEGSPSIVLEVNNGKRHFEKIPLVQGQSLFVADLIRDAKLQKKIGRIKMTILRPNGPNLPPVRLDVDFDDSGKHVMEGQNYSLRAGDHIVVRQDDRSAFSSMIPDMAFIKK